jgi:hypothetical protein
VLTAGLVFFPGSYAMRAVVKSREGAPEPLSSLPGFSSFLDATDAYAQALAANPWLETFPAPLLQVVPVLHQERRSLRDADGHALPVAPRFARGWQLLALSGGDPIDLFGEWDGTAFLPLSAMVGGRFFRLDGGAA